MTSGSGTSDAVEVPGPEPDWTFAAQHQGRKGNPTLQYFMWDQAIGDFREIALLRVRFPDVANRLRLVIEEGMAHQLGPVEAAFFSISRIGFAISRWKGEPVGVTVWLHRADTVTPEEALDQLVTALGVDRAAVATSVDAGGRWTEATPG